MILKNVILLALCAIYSIQAKIDKNKFIKNPKIVIFDGGQTLIPFDTFKAVKHISSFGSWMFFLKRAVTGTDIPQYLTDFYFDKLSQIQSPVKINHQSLIGPNDKVITPLQTACWSGKIGQTQAINYALGWIDNNKGQFQDSTLTKIFEQLIYLNFDANILINHLKFNDNNLNILKYSYNQKDVNGKRKNVIIIIANTSKELVSLLKRTFSQIFQFSDAQIFSCDIGHLKPDLTIFEHAISLCPNNCQRDCFYIDEQNSILNLLQRKKVKHHILNPFTPNEFRSVI